MSDTRSGIIVIFPTGFLCAPRSKKESTPLTSSTGVCESTCSLDMLGRPCPLDILWRRVCCDAFSPWTPVLALVRGGHARHTWVHTVAHYFRSLFPRVHVHVVLYRTTRVFQCDGSVRYCGRCEPYLRFNSRASGSGECKELTLRCYRRWQHLDPARLRATPASRCSSRRIKHFASGRDSRS
jgi:hypothetical protein